jgi:PAS domain S-box-containing protein
MAGWAGERMKSVSEENGDTLMPDCPGFLAGGGTMGAEVRAFDWSTHALGPVDSWPATLRTMVGLVLNTSLLATLMWGPELRLVFNDAYAPALGHRRQGALGAPVTEVWADIWDRLAPTFLPVLETGIPVFEKRFALPMVRDGKLVTTYWDYSVTPVFDAPGAIVGLLNIALDVTQEVTNEQALLAVQARLQDANLGLQDEVKSRTDERDRMWALAQELMLVAHPDGRISGINPLWADRLGLMQDDLIDRPLQRIVHPEDAAKAMLMLEEVRHAPVSKPVELRLQHRDGTYRLFSWVGAFGNGRFFATGRDITLEREQSESLRQSQKMEAVGQLTGGLAHDFNNLLGGISGALEMSGLRAQQGRLADIDGFVASGLGAVKRAAALTHRLLAFARKQPLAPKVTDVDGLIDGMLELITRTVGPGVAVKVSTSHAGHRVLVDQPQLENALLNLCINARDAMEGAGRISILTRSRAIDARTAAIEQVEPGMYVALQVTDTGRGMTPEVTSRAFDPFFTTKPVGQGTGLGLSMIYGFVRQSGGTVEIESQPGHGTTVTVSLPINDGPADDDGSHDERPGPTDKAGASTVFVVDDEPTVRLLVTSLLEDASHTVIEASDSAGGLRVLESDARIDLLVTDVGLPGGMDGRAMVATARHLRPHLPVLFITGFADAFDGAELSGPGWSVLMKPFSIDAFRSAVDSLLASRNTE